MTDLLTRTPTVPRRNARVARIRGAIAVIIALAVVVGGVGFVVVKGKSALAGMLDQQRDYEGTGTGTVTVTIAKGSSLTAIGAVLTRDGVVFNADAFVRAAGDNDDAQNIQAGTYRLKAKMSGAAAVSALLDTTNRIIVKVTIPEGMRSADIFAALAKKSGVPVKEFQAAAAKPRDLGLPAYAKTVEGYLFPATYQFEPRMTASSMLTAMVSRYLDEVEKLNLTAAARAQRITVGQLVTVASLAQAEVNRSQDYGKVARVVYNRLAKGRKLQFDTPIKYAHGYDGKVLLTYKQLHENNPYNDYLHAGLPPTPIGSPGAEALGAAAEPTPGTWLYFVAINPDTGATEFSTSEAGFNASRTKALQWCSTHKGRC
jgi:UPF0755 protein